MRVEGLAALVSVVVASAAAAQETVPGTDEAELAAAQSDFEYGKYRQVLDRAEQRIDRSGLDDPALLQWHRLAGLAAFNLKRMDQAQRHIAAVLRIDPDFALDPFVYPPPAVAFVEKQRQAMAPELDRIRAERRAQEAAARKAAEERAALTRQAEEERRKLEEMSRQVTVRTVEKRSFLVNFVPFGAGQFQQGRVATGTGFAIAEALLGITSVVAYFAYGSLVETRTIPLENRFPGTSTVVETGIPANREDEAKVWRALKIGAGLGFYGVYAAGVADAIIHHQDVVVTTRVETPPNPPSPPPGPSAHIGPGPGTVGASVTVRF
jgi:tetratricopeptide (TPR) repeat protein